MSSAKLIILISWFPFSTPFIPFHYQINGQGLSSYSNRAAWRGSPLPGSLHENKKVHKGGDYLYILILCWIMLWAICKWQLKLLPYPRNKNKFQSTVKCLRKVNENCSIWFTKCVGASIYILNKVIIMLISLAMQQFIYCQYWI